MAEINLQTMNNAKSGTCVDLCEDAQIATRKGIAYRKDRTFYTDNGSLTRIAVLYKGTCEKYDIVNTCATRLPSNLMGSCVFYSSGTSTRVPLG
jgi:hypothetical protein